ncbi:MAG: type IV-A pilus assembly ATPase PilB [Cellvibrionales bacterium]|nr:type IV-A pilus assembly ATPase PilB [Cellvibrionales bacterium]
MNTVSVNGLARRLVNDGLINMEQAQNALLESRKAKIPLTQWLVDNKVVAAKAIALAAMDEFGVPLYDISSHNLAQIPKDVVKRELISKHQVLPLFKRGSRLFLGMTDPTDLRALEEVRFQTGLTSEAVLVQQDQLAKAIEKFLNDTEEDANEAFKGLDEDFDLDVEAVDDDEPKGDGGEAGVDDAPIVRFVNKILLDAIKGGSSDLHFEPYEKAYRIRFRTDGVLHEVARPPLVLGPKLSSRLKVMSKMDISERRLPQDGRIKMKLSKTKAIDFRVNTLPTLWGEKVVMRILDPTSAQMGIDALGYEDYQKEMYMKALMQPQGMILVTGPTGSGKTVSLYTGLNILNTEERNISTAEDPVEINLEGINQVNVNARIGLDFSSALRAFLRQDPDIIMVGEIRDLDTANIAIKAAQTGHMVMSTLHTNSAPETLTRMLNMGVPSFNLATSVNLIIAQRLARRLCSACKQPATEIPDSVLEEEGLFDCGLERSEVTVFKPVGCELCNGGYKGRLGVYEVVRITPKISQIIMEEGNSLQIAQAAKEEGFFDLRRSGLRKCAWGLTSLEEINRVTKD